MKLRTTLLAGMAAATALLPSGDAHAFAFVDYSALAQRLAQFTTTIAQIRAIVRSGQENLQMVQAAYEGAKNWRNLGWIDTLQIVNAPWFDDVEGIDDIRAAVMTTTLSTEQTVGLWADLNEFNAYLQNPRYKKDAWFRAKVRSLLRQSKRARAIRMATMRQIKAQNKALTEDIKKIKRLRDAIEAANRNAKVGKPVNQSEVQAMQAELAATEAKYQGEELMLRNQRVLMGIAGEDEAHRSFMEVFRDKDDWRLQNATRLREFGRGFSK